jgi:hypothetical protein
MSSRDPINASMNTPMNVPMNARLKVRWFALACCLAFAAAGCAHKTVHASAPVPAPPAPAVAEAERPMTIAPDTDAVPPVEDTAAPPVVADDAAPPPAPVATARAPRKPAEPPVPGTATETASRPPAPQISPQLSQVDQASYERKTNEDVSAARKNLQAAQGKQLNAAQQDLLEKIRSFLAQSLDASKSGDWARAQNLAQKARLLSTELINSF